MAGECVARPGREKKGGYEAAELLSKILLSPKKDAATRCKLNLENEDYDDLTNLLSLSLLFLLHC